jgi:hypothetical protein
MTFSFCYFGMLSGGVMPEATTRGCEITVIGHCGDIAAISAALKPPAGGR